MKSRRIVQILKKVKEMFAFKWKFSGFILVLQVFLNLGDETLDNLQSADRNIKYSESDTIIKTPNENVITNNFMYLYKTGDKSDGQTMNYLNYRDVYGLRYVPTKKPIKPKFAFEASTSQEPFFNSSILNASSAYESQTEEINNKFLPSSVESETMSHLEGETSSSSESSSDEENLSHSNFSVQNIEPVVDETRNHIMKPNNRVEHALDFLADRLKKLIYYSKDRDRPESKISPHLTTLGRFLDLFSFVRFENAPCITARKPISQLSGTCYNEIECLSSGGIAVDRCANGFGVCCICKFYKCFSNNLL